jgi:hypothetical protein
VLDFIGKGDVLLVTRVDRLARSIGDVQDIVRTLEAKRASLRATEQPIDTSTAAGKCFLDMLGVFAEFETNLRRERQLEGIAKGVLIARRASLIVIHSRFPSGNILIDWHRASSVLASKLWWQLRLGAGDKSWWGGQDRGNMNPASSACQRPTRHLS